MLENRTVVITGAAGAVGSVVAAEFAAAGASVLALDRREALDRAGLPQDVTPIAVDLLDPANVLDTIANVRSSRPSIDGLLCLAGGFFGDTSLLDTGVDIARQQMELNYLTAYTTVQATVPAMVESGGGSVVCVSSRPAVTTVPGSVAYAASKAAVLKLVDLLAAEYGEQGVRANAIVPSIIDTPANRQAMPDADASRWVTPQQVASVLQFLVSDASEVVSGAHIPVYGRA